MVHFVGAGCGAKDLITVRGMKLLESAEIIIYAGSLVNPELLEYAPETCEIYDSAVMALGEIIDICSKANAVGKDVIRLHTGDPSLYGAIAEQMKELDKLGIAYDLCPGVSAYQGAAAALNIEYTLPGRSQTVILTRAEGRTPVPEAENLTKLAGTGATMAIYLSSGMPYKVQEALLAGGMSEHTPVIIVYKASWPEEKIVRSTLADFAACMEQEKINKTAVILVGENLAGIENEYSCLYDAAFETMYRGAKCDA